MSVCVMGLEKGYWLQWIHYEGMQLGMLIVSRKLIGQLMELFRSAEQNNEVASEQHSCVLN